MSTTDTKKKYMHYSDEPIIEDDEIIGYALVAEPTDDESELSTFDISLSKKHQISPTS